MSMESVQCEVNWWLDCYECGRRVAAAGAPSPELFAAEIYPAL